MATAAKVVGQAFWDTDAEFRADVLAIHNALIAEGGLVQTADTGQTDFTANTRAAPGYTVYRFDDEHQADYPLFLKITWTPTSTGRPGCSWELGTGTNGAGAITGALRGATVCGGGSSAPAGNNADHLVSVGEGYVYVLFGMGSTGSSGYSAMFMVERNTDLDGVVHPEEGVMSFSTPANGKSYAAHPTGKASIGPSINVSPFDVAMSWHLFDDVEGPDIALMPAIYISRGKIRCHRACLLRPSRVSYGVPFEVEYLGQARMYFSVETTWANTSSSSGWGRYDSTVNGPAIAIPWI